MANDLKSSTTPAPAVQHSHLKAAEHNDAASMAHKEAAKHVDAGDEQQHAATLLWLGSSWCRVVFADRFLLRSSHRDFCQYEGLLSQSGG